jgi:hypothetical protein
MPLLNEADEIYIGADPIPVEQIYIGDTPIWAPTYSVMQVGGVFGTIQVVKQRNQ